MKMERLKHAFRRSSLAPPYYWLRNRRGYADFGPPLGWLRFGSFRRVTPVSRWHERGTSIDRYYIHRFLSSNASDIYGHVLEVGGDDYTRRFGADRVTRSDVLHRQEGNPKATIVADLSQAPQIPSDTFDCIILTQILQWIPDMRAALATIHRILKPGGVLLATVPSLSQVWHEETDLWRELWRMTDVGARHLFGERFPDAEIASYGNVLAAIASLHGLAVDELRPEELNSVDYSFQIVVTVRAVKRVQNNLILE